MYMKMSQGNFLSSYLKQTKIIFFFLLQNQKKELSCLGELAPVERVKEGEYDANTVYT
jgi:hypothetical protein